MSTLLPRLHDRQNQKEFTNFEWERIQEFNKAVSNKSTTLEGYAGSCRGAYFCLVPLPHLGQVYVNCTCIGIPAPPENAYISVQGKWNNILISKGERIAAPVFFASNITRENDQLLRNIRPEIGFNDFEEHLFSKWHEVDPFVKEYIALELVSSPAVLRRTGGIKNTLYNLDAEDAAIKMQGDILNNVWEDVLKDDEYKITTPLGEITAEKYKWTIYVGSVDEGLTAPIKEALSNPETEANKEISLGLASKNKIPSISDLPVTGTDICTILNEGASRISRKLDAKEDPFAIQKYMITMHMFHPVVDSHIEQNILQVAEEELSKLPKRYDLSPEILSRSSFLNLNYWGKPLSILKLALSESRTRGQRELDLGLGRQVIDKFTTYFDDIYDAFDKLPKHNEFNVVQRRLTLNERRIWRYVSEKGSLGRDEIKNAFGFSEIELDSILDTLCNIIGVLYKNFGGKYKAVSDY